MAWKGKAGFKAGDFIEFTMSNGTVLRGAALTDLDSTGLASFAMYVPGIERNLELNANQGTVEVLFRADIARSFGHR